jgi:alpha-N-arabinofuranosidase
VSAAETRTARYGDVPVVAAAATHDPETGQVALFVTNRAPTDTVVEVGHRAFGSGSVRSARVVAADDKGPLEGAEAAEQARPVELSDVRTDEGTTTLRMPPESWAAVLVDTTGAA